MAIFDGTITYGEVPDNMYVRTAHKRLSNGQYTVGVSVKVYKNSNQTQHSFSAIGKFSLIKDSRGNWIIK